MTLSSAPGADLYRRYGYDVAAGGEPSNAANAHDVAAALETAHTLQSTGATSPSTGSKRRSPPQRGPEEDGVDNVTARFSSLYRLGAVLEDEHSMAAAATASTAAATLPGTHATPIVPTKRAATSWGAQVLPSAQAQDARFSVFDGDLSGIIAPGEDSTQHLVHTVNLALPIRASAAPAPFARPAAPFAIFSDDASENVRPPATDAAALGASALRTGRSGLASAPGVLSTPATGGPRFGAVGAETAAAGQQTARRPALAAREISTPVPAAATTDAAVPVFRTMTRNGKARVVAVNSSTMSQSLLATAAAAADEDVTMHTRMAFEDVDALFSSPSFRPNMSRTAAPPPAISVPPLPTPALAPAPVPAPSMPRAAIDRLPPGARRLSMHISNRTTVAAANSAAARQTFEVFDENAEAGHAARSHVHVYHDENKPAHGGAPVALPASRAREGAPALGHHPLRPGLFESHEPASAPVPMHSAAREHHTPVWSEQEVAFFEAHEAAVQRGAVGAFARGSVASVRPPSSSFAIYVDPENAGRGGNPHSSARF